MERESSSPYTDSSRDLTVSDLAGIFHRTTADTLKLIMKEGLTPDGADKFLFNLAPFVVMIAAMLILAPIAFAKGLQMWDLNIWVLYVISSSLYFR